MVTLWKFSQRVVDGHAAVIVRNPSPSLRFQSLFYTTLVVSEAMVEVAAKLLFNSS